MYRTLYCAEQRITCFRETLAGFRPSARMVREHRELFGDERGALGSVPWGWLGQQGLAAGRIQLDEGELVDVDEPSLRQEFEWRHVDLLMAHGMDHLDITEVRSRDRIVTQALSRWLFDQGAAGVVYRSNLDNLPCVALFEGRASVVSDLQTELLTGKPAELIQVCEEFGLVLGLEG